MKNQFAIASPFGEVGTMLNVEHAALIKILPRQFFKTYTPFFPFGRVIASLAIMLFWCGEEAFAKRPVIVELVLAVDTSTSVDEIEFKLQRDGLAAAFAHPDFLGIIAGMGKAGIAVSLIEWAGTQDQAVIVPWALINDEASALAFSRKISAASRKANGSTDIAAAIRFSVDQLDQNAFEGRRRVIDVSGDGASSYGGSERERDRAILKGITINGLVIFSRDIDLGQTAEVNLIQHYSNSVIGGNGAFLMVAETFEDFESAIRKKLIREILGSGSANLIE